MWEGLTSGNNWVILELKTGDETVVMYREEILFCSKIASSLGYDKEVMFELMLHVKSVAMKDDEVSALKEMIQKFLIK